MSWPRLWKLEEKKAQLPLDLTHRAKMGFHTVSPGRSKWCPVNLTSDKAKEEPGYKNRVVGRPKLLLVVSSLRAVFVLGGGKREREKTVGRFHVTWIGRGEACSRSHTDADAESTQP